MRLTTRGRFAVTAMIDLALNERAIPVSLAEISQRQEISLSYLEQLFAKLRRRQLVDSVRGPGGGYVLARDPAAISVAEVIAAVDEPIDATQCGGQRNCNGHQKPCMTHHLWEGLNHHIADYLESVNLAQLVVKHIASQRGSVAAVPVTRKARVLQQV